MLSLTSFLATLLYFICGKLEYIFKRKFYAEYRGPRLTKKFKNLLDVEQTFNKRMAGLKYLSGS